MVQESHLYGAQSLVTQAAGYQTKKGGSAPEKVSSPKTRTGFWTGIQAYTPDQQCYHVPPSASDQRYERQQVFGESMRDLCEAKTAPSPSPARSFACTSLVMTCQGWPIVNTPIHTPFSKVQCKGGIKIHRKSSKVELVFMASMKYITGINAYRTAAWFTGLRDISPA